MRLFHRFSHMEANAPGGFIGALTGEVRLACAGRNISCVHAPDVNMPTVGEYIHADDGFNYTKFAYPHPLVSGGIEPDPAPDLKTPAIRTTAIQDRAVSLQPISNNVILFFASPKEKAAFQFVLKRRAHILLIASAGIQDILQFLAVVRFDHPICGSESAPEAREDVYAAIRQGQSGRGS